MIFMLIVPLAVVARAFEFLGARAGSGGGLVGTLVATVLFAPVPALCATALYYELRSDEPQDAVQTAVAPLPVA